jgi:hypothetical protein
MPVEMTRARTWIAICTRQSRLLPSDFPFCEAQLLACLSFVMDRLGDNWRTQVRDLQSGNRTGGGRWTACQILDRLSNPVYIGMIRDGDRTRPGGHQAIVAAENFKRSPLSLRPAGLANLADRSLGRRGSCRVCRSAGKADAP